MEGTVTDQANSIPNPDAECEAMKVVGHALAPLDRETRIRVLNWAMRKYVNHPAGIPASIAGAAMTREEIHAVHAQLVKS
jgi:hypothetical protein